MCVRYAQTGVIVFRALDVRSRYQLKRALRKPADVGRYPATRFVTRFVWFTLRREPCKSGGLDRDR